MAQARLERLSSRVQAALTASSELPADASEQLELGVRLYKKMLLSFLAAEERRLRQTDFTPLLSNDAFHTSLLGCCLE